MLLPRVSHAKRENADTPATFGRARVSMDGDLTTRRKQRERRDAKMTMIFVGDEETKSRLPPVRTIRKKGRVRKGKTNGQELIELITRAFIYTRVEGIEILRCAVLRNRQLDATAKVARVQRSDEISMRSRADGNCEIA